MIIDAHGHAFPRLGTDSEDPGELQLRFIQYHTKAHPQGWRRRRDGMPAPTEFLAPQAEGLDGLTKVDFRVGNYGQVECTVGAEDYYLQWYPVSLRDNAAPPELLIAYMDYVGVDMAVLQHDHVYGAQNAFLSECAAKYPGRFLPLAQIREWRASDDAELNRLESSISHLGLRGLYFAMEGFAATGCTDRLDDRRFDALWTMVDRLGVPVFWYIDAQRIHGLRDYMDQVHQLDAWAQAWPSIPAVLTHGNDISDLQGGTDRFLFPESLLRFLKRPNVSVEVNLHLAGDVDPFPFTWTRDVLRDMYDRIGPRKLIWGSDMPGAERTVTYRQAMDYVRINADFMSASDLDDFYGGNIARVFGLSTR